MGEAGQPGVMTVDTITKLDETHRGQVVIAASHGGEYAGYCAAKGHVRAVIFNDAGVGKDRAGLGSPPHPGGLRTAAGPGRSAGASAPGSSTRIPWHPYARAMSA